MSDLLDKAHTNDTQDSQKSFVGKSLLSIFSGNPDPNDTNHRLIDKIIDSNQYTTGTKVFYTKCTRVDNHSQTYDTPFIKSPYGAYIVVDTPIPINKDGVITTTSGYAVLFSQHPEFLKQTFIDKGGDKDRLPSTPEEQEEKILVLDARYDHNATHKNAENDEHYLIGSWIRDAIEKHAIEYGRDLKLHGSLLKSRGDLLRSASSVFWFEEDKENKGHYHRYYYGNPHHGQERLFAKKSVLDKGVARALLKQFSIKLDHVAPSKQEAYEDTHKDFTKISRALMRNQDPYDLFKPSNITGKIKHWAKKTTVRTAQKIMNTISNINVRHMLMTAGISGALVVVTKLPVLLLASLGKTNLLVKSGQAATRAASKHLSPVENKQRNFQHNVKELLCAHKGQNTEICPYRGNGLNHQYIEHMQPLSLDLVINNFPEIVEYTPRHEEEWAKSVLLNTLGYQPGNIFSEVSFAGHNLLRAQQSNGVDVYYRSDNLVAFAHQARSAHKHACLEEPIAKLFDSMPNHHDILGVRLCDDHQLELQTFPMLNEVPKDFIGKQSTTIETLQRQGRKPEKLRRPATHFPLLAVIPEHKANATKKKALKEIKRSLTNSFKGYDQDTEDRTTQYCDKAITDIQDHNHLRL